jgi:S1-C subfamily serine protease
LPDLPPDSPLQQLFKDYLNQDKNVPHHVTSLGSGFIIDPSGLIVTNNHVIDEADEITVTLNDGTSLPAKVVGRDEKTDLALLRVKRRRRCPSAHFGDSDRARIGDWVIAIGNPFGLGSTVTAGIVSARNRDIAAGPYDDFIQTDAPINRGNSGGPLFDMAGNVVGVNSEIYSPTGGSVGIGFAIPSNMARKVIDELRQYRRSAARLAGRARAAGDERHRGRFGLARHDRRARRRCDAGRARRESGAAIRRSDRGLRRQARRRPAHAAAHRCRYACRQDGRRSIICAARRKPRM